jgi:hypothetical protein
MSSPRRPAGAAQPRSELRAKGSIISTAGRTDGWGGDSVKYGAWQLLRACPLDHRTLPRLMNAEKISVRGPPALAHTAEPSEATKVDRSSTYSVIVACRPDS